MSHTSMTMRQMSEKVMPAAVQIVALKRSMFGQVAPAWTGSGTIIDPRGLILTNCHVANPRAMGMPAPEADALGVAITSRSDEPPAVTYIAKCLVFSAELDLAVLQIVSTINGQQVGNLNLPYLALGNSDELELGDKVNIFGYPGIGGQTITFTSGTISGFNAEHGYKRAWVKTDATIAGGNSGGTAVDDDACLIGIPTQAASGANVMPVDARPVVDTNRDGRVDQNDAPVVLGGFINGLRPINLAKPLLERVGAQIQQGGHAHEAAGMGGGVTAPQMPQQGAAAFSPIIFSSQVTEDGRPINPAAQLPSGMQQIFASFEFRNMQNGMPWNSVWTFNNTVIAQNQDRWNDGPNGRKTVTLGNQHGLPSGVYELTVGVNGQPVTRGEVAIGGGVGGASAAASQVSGSVVNAATGQPIQGVLVLALKPGVACAQFIQTQDKVLIASQGFTDANGAFAMKPPLAKGQAYSLLAIGRGYNDLAVDGALQVTPNAPAQAQIQPIQLQPE